MSGPLQGVRILAVEQYAAGPFGTQHLADLGAEVIKVENHRLGGDHGRSIGPYFVEGVEDDSASLFFQSINRNKKSLSLDLAHPEGIKVFHRLVTISDAVANNLRGDVPERLGLTYDQLSPYNQAIVCAHCSAYGREGARRSWPGYDFLMQAETGYFHMSGEPGTPPTRMGLSIVDFMAGTYMALGLLAAVLRSRTSGVGRDVDVNLFDTALFNLSYLATWALNSDYSPARVPRSAHATIVPSQLFRTADDWIFLMCNKEKFWQELCEAIERPDLATDPRFGSFQARHKHRDELTRVLDGVLEQGTTAFWLEKFAGKIPSAPVQTPRQALDDPEMELAGRVETLSATADESRYRTLSSPIRTGQSFDNAPCPSLGKDTRAILLDAGFSEEEIDELKNAGAI